MSNKYTPCGGFIIASDGQQYPVETAHPLPLPEGIDDMQTQPNGGAASVCYGDTARPHQGWQAWSQKSDNPTHWIARRPLPKVPRIKTQEELDEEAFAKMWKQFGTSADEPYHRFTWKAALIYARQCPDKPAA